MPGQVIHNVDNLLIKKITPSQTPSIPRQTMRQHMLTTFPTKSYNCNY